MKRTPGGESKVPEIVEREALRDEVLFYYSSNEYKFNPWQLSDREDLSIQGFFLVVRGTRSVEGGGGGLALPLHLFDALRILCNQKGKTLYLPNCFKVSRHQLWLVMEGCVIIN